MATTVHAKGYGARTEIRVSGIALSKSSFVGVSFESPSVVFLSFHLSADEARALAAALMREADVVEPVQATAADLGLEAA